MPGSCDWILTTPQIRRCVILGDSFTLSIQDRPGTGKSVLSSFLIDHLKEQNQACVLYFFCKASDIERRDPTYVHRTLLAQLLQYDHSLHAYIEPFYNTSGRVTADSFVDVSACILLAVSRTLHRQIFIVVDALDECENVEAMLKVLFDARSSASAQVNMIFTSRPIQTSFGFDAIMALDASSVDTLIGKYIEHRVLQMKRLSGSALSMMIVDRISGAADGLWLYARLMLDEIEKLPSAALIERHLGNVPHGLTQLYTQILHSKESTFSDIDLKFAQQIFLWLDLGDYLPAFIHTDSLTYDTLSLVLQQVNFGQPVFDPINLLSTLCSPLVIANDYRDDGNTDSLHDFEIISIHYTADQYIKASQEFPTSSLPLVLRPRKLRQLHRSITAVWYFTECKVSKEILDVYRRSPYIAVYGSYFEMSYGIWGALKLVSIPNDLDAREIVEASKLMNEIMSYLDPNSFHCLTWIESAVIINYAGDWDQLLGNAEHGLELMQTRTYTADLPILDTYRTIRLTFFLDYVYVLRLTGPRRRPLEKSIPMPDGFLTRPLAIEMLRIGRKWEHLHRYVTENHLLHLLLTFRANRSKMIPTAFLRRKSRTPSIDRMQAATQKMDLEDH